MKNILIILLTYSSLIATIQAQLVLTGIYEGTFEEYTPDDGYDDGDFIAFVDSNNNVTLWTGNEYLGDKYRFKINAQGSGAFKSSGGYNVDIKFNSDGGINLSLDRGATASATTTTKIGFPYTPGAATLSKDLMANPTFYSNNPLELSLDGIGQNQLSSTLKDQLTLLSGEWSTKAKASVNDGYGGTVNVNLTGDMIITPNGIFFYVKARGESAFIRFDASTTNYNDVSLTRVAYDFAKRTLSASGDVTLEGYNGTVSYTIKQSVSYYDTDKDGLSDYEEINTYSTNPLKSDSDGDRMSDYAEVEAGTNPNDKSEYPAYLKLQVSLAKGILIAETSAATVSIDGASYPLSLVRGKGTVQVALPTGSTYTVSASMDALTSGIARSVTLTKAKKLTLVLDGDSDKDGLPDSLEARYKGDPDNADTDGDGISDGEEVYKYRTRVNLADTDKDGFTDKQEIDLGTNPLSPKDKPAAYIERPVLIDWLLTFEATDGYINEDWDTAAVAYFLSSAAGDPQQNATIHLKYSLDGSNTKWIVRNNSGDTDVSSLMSPIKVSKPAQLEGEVISPIDGDGSYYVAQMFSLAIKAGKTKSLSLVVAGQSAFIPVGENSSGLDIDLAIESDYTALGLLKDSSMSDGPILIEGTLTMGNEVANVLGQSIGPVN
jgi:hypothetical protein